MRFKLSKSIVRIGIVGAGSTTIARQIPYFQKIKDVEIVGISNRSLKSGMKVARDFNIPKVFESWDELVISPDIDAVYIGTWPYLHHPVTIEALKNGKHVLTQARMAMNATEAKEMLKVSRRFPELVTQVFPATRSFTVDHVISQMIADRYLGDLLSFDLSDNAGMFDGIPPYTWRHDRELSGDNVMALGYWFEIINRWLGDASSVLAVTKTNLPNRYDAHGKPRITDIPDHVEVISEFVCGVVAHIRISDVMGFAPPSQAWFFGSEGTLMLDLLTMDLFGGRRGEKGLAQISVPISEDDDISCSPEQEFIDAIRGVGRVKFNTFEVGVKYMDLIEAAKLSSETGRAVQLPL